MKLPTKTEAKEVLHGPLEQIGHSSFMAGGLI
jgi:hypothetical protein